METGGGTFDCTLQQKEPAGFQGCDDLQPFLRRQLLRRDPHPFQFPIDGVQSHRICGVAEFFRGGSGGVSAVPMAARVSQMVGQKYNPGNFLLMHAMGPNVAGVIGSAIAAGVLISLYG